MFVPCKQMCTAAELAQDAIIEKRSLEQMFDKKINNGMCLFVCTCMCLEHKERNEGKKSLLILLHHSKKIECAKRRNEIKNKLFKKKIQQTCIMSLSEPGALKLVLCKYVLCFRVLQ
jgi:hypothetical protein